MIIDIISAKEARFYTDAAQSDRELTTLNEIGEKILKSAEHGDETCYFDVPIQVDIEKIKSTLRGLGYTCQEVSPPEDNNFYITIRISW